MKKLTVLIVVALSTAASAAAPTVSDNANSNACFGQARAYYAQLLASTGTSNGYYISQRKGDNPAENQAYRDANCS
jgi:hypothetical protein